MMLEKILCSLLSFDSRKLSVQSKLLSKKSFEPTTASKSLNSDFFSLEGGVYVYLTFKFSSFGERVLWFCESNCFDGLNPSIVFIAFLGEPSVELSSLKDSCD